MNDHIFSCKFNQFNQFYGGLTLFTAGGVQLICTHRLADTRVASLVDAAHKDPTGESHVEAEVDQHVPKLTAHTDRPERNEHIIRSVNSLDVFTLAIFQPFLHISESQVNKKDYSR